VEPGVHERRSDDRDPKEDYPRDRVYGSRRGRDAGSQGLHETGDGGAGVTDNPLRAFGCSRVTAPCADLFKQNPSLHWLELGLEVKYEDRTFKIVQLGGEEALLEEIK